MALTTVLRTNVLHCDVYVELTNAHYHHYSLLQVVQEVSNVVPSKFWVYIRIAIITVVSDISVPNILFDFYLCDVVSGSLLRQHVLSSVLPSQPVLCLND